MNSQFELQRRGKNYFVLLKYFNKICLNNLKNDSASAFMGHVEAIVGSPIVRK